MTVYIDGITYEGTVDEIRQIVENPPRRGSARAESEPKDRLADEDSKKTTPHAVPFPKDGDDDDGGSVVDGRKKRKQGRKHDDWIYPINLPPYPHYPPHAPVTWWDYPCDYPKNWDGSPSVTC